MGWACRLQREIQLYIILTSGIYIYMIMAVSLVISNNNNIMVCDNGLSHLCHSYTVIQTSTTM